MDIESYKKDVETKMLTQEMSRYVGPNIYFGAQAYIHNFLIFA